MAAFIVLFFVLGILRTQESLKFLNNALLSGKEISTQGTVLKNSESLYGQNLIVELADIKEKVLIQVPEYPEFKYGDILDVKCELKMIENKNAQFDWRMLMAKDGVHYSCEKEKITAIPQNGGNVIWRNVFKIKEVFEQKIYSSMPMPEGVLASGILFGGTNGLSEEIINDFSRTGMTHIVAVSGYNVTIIAEYLILLGILMGLWRKQAIIFAIVGIIIFVVMIGSQASAVRAGVMSSVLLWAVKNGRLASSENGIVLAAAVMLFFNPLLLRWDVGFQLSFLATLGIIFTSRFWEREFFKNFKAFGLTEIIILSLSAQIFVLPIIVYNFQSASTISLVANVLILPIVPISMLLVFLVSLLGIAFEPLGQIISWMAYLPLHYEIKVIHYLSSLSWASVEVGKFSGWWILGYYLILSVIAYYINKGMQISSKIKN